MSDIHLMLPKIDTGRLRMKNENSTSNKDIHLDIKVKTKEIGSFLMELFRVRMTAFQAWQDLNGNLFKAAHLRQPDRENSGIPR